ncbi:flagellar brake protein [Peribacillus sp. SCS-26]|uniref:flagellar brake protein n=1 Tax=Paraperibacillus marinus TaxID=3115295 RepID=UPI0039059A76
MLKIGEMLTLEPKYSAASEKYEAMIVELADGGVYIDYPVNLTTRKTVFLLDGSQLKASCVGKDNNVYMFDTEVQGRRMANIPMIKLFCPEEAEILKIQRRQYVRIEAAADVAIHPEGASSPPFATVTLDISAGGICAAVPHNVSIEGGDQASLWLVLPLKNGEIHYLKAEGRISRVNETKTGLRNASIEFTGLDPADRQYVLRYCFEKQLEMKQKGLAF